MPAEMVGMGMGDKPTWLPTAHIDSQPGWRKKQTPIPVKHGKWKAESGKWKAEGGKGDSG
jgi:hypothetical protein